MPLTRRALLAEGSRAAAVAGTAVIGLLGVRAARPQSAPSAVDAIDPGIDVPTAKDEVLIVPESDRVVALSRRCTHLGCRLNVDESGRGFVCPCHGSRFDLRGARVLGPAARNLSIVATIPR